MDRENDTITAADRLEMIRVIDAFDTSANFFVQTEIYYYQPTPVAVLEKTGREGTTTISPHSVIVYKDGDFLDSRSSEVMRQIWIKAVSESVIEKTRLDAEVEVPLIKAARYPVPTEFTVDLPIPKRFKDNPVYRDIFKRESNGPGFDEVVRNLIPFAQTRAMIARLQNRLVVPLHHVNILSTIQGAAPMMRGR